MMKEKLNFIPDIPNPSPDYYCTWQTQLYATSDGKPEGQRRAMNEQGIFDTAFPFHWADFYKKSRRDLFFVMDDSWDVPPNGDKSKYGSLILDKEKFSGFYSSGDSDEALKSLSDKILSFGWKGLGGWICAQESPVVMDNTTYDAYWIERLKAARYSGMRYWKVDWGSKDQDAAFRKRITELARKYAPDLFVEHAMNADFISFSDVFRTYDVPAIMSIPMTLEKLAAVLKKARYTGEALSLVNCEDEAYISAAGGFTMGIMRHPYAGNFPNGKPDMSFPACHRDLKRKTEEVFRAARYHRIAPAFAADSKEVCISETLLTDTWRFVDSFAEMEEWWFSLDSIKDFMSNGVLKKTAPAAISRRMPLPQITPDENGEIPYVVCSKNPNGVVSAAFLARTKERRYYTPLCDITLDAGEAEIVGLFGYFKSVSLKFDVFIEGCRGFVQNHADDFSYHITEPVFVSGHSIHIPFSAIKEIVTSEDKSEPGFIIKIMKH